MKLNRLSLFILIVLLASTFGCAHKRVQYDAPCTTWVQRASSSCMAGQNNAQSYQTGYER